LPGNTTVFFECGDIAEVVKPNPSSDRLFASFFDDIKKRARDKDSLNAIRDYTDQRIALEVASRLLYLRKLADKMKNDLTPEGYLVSQLNGAQEIIRKIINILKFSSTERLRTLVGKVLISLKKDVLKEQRIIFAVDEVNVGYRVLKDRKIWQSPRSKDPRGVLTPFIQYISNHPHGATTIYAGTSISMSVLDTIQSDIGKDLYTVFVKEFPILTTEDVKKRLSLWLKLGAEEEQIIDKYYKHLIGRPRFSSMVPVFLAPKENLLKTEVLTFAIADNKQNLFEKLKSRLISSHREASIETIRNLEELLLKLYIKSSLGLDRINIELSENLINIGIASLRNTRSASGESKDYCVVEEPNLITQKDKPQCSKCLEYKEKLKQATSDPDNVLLLMIKEVAGAKSLNDIHLV